MQWKRVKQILIVLLLVTDVLLAWMVMMPYQAQRQETKQFTEDLAVVLARRGVVYHPQKEVRPMASLPRLYLDRDMQAEEQFVMLFLEESNLQKTIEEGIAQYQGKSGEVWFYPDGTVEASRTIPEQIRWRKKQNYAKETLKRCQVLDKGQWETENTENLFTYTQPVLQAPVWNRFLTISFPKETQMDLHGRWSFSVPYVFVSDTAKEYAVADALLMLVQAIPTINSITDVTFGYQMAQHVAGGYQLLPCWQVETNEKVYTIDAQKKTMLL